MVAARTGVLSPQQGGSLFANHCKQTHRQGKDFLCNGAVPRTHNMEYVRASCLNATWCKESWTSHRPFIATKQHEKGSGMSSSRSKSKTRMDRKRSDGVSQKYFNRQLQSSIIDACGAGSLRPTDVSLGRCSQLTAGSYLAIITWLVDVVVVIVTEFSVASVRVASWTLRRWSFRTWELGTICFRSTAMLRQLSLTVLIRLTARI